MPDNQPINLVTRLSAVCLLALFLSAFISGCANTPTTLSPDTIITHIAFGSCARENKPQPIWHTIADSNPQLFLFIGDNIYGDTEDMAVLQAKYDKLAAKDGFIKLRATCPLLATWDDHDYGSNDAGVEYPKKAESQKLFLKFYNEPKSSPRWQRPGIYHSYMLGPADKRVQIILLDTRYFRSPILKWPRGKRKTPGPYMPDPNPEKTMLGDAQWKWLKGELKKPAAVRIIASSIQVVSEQHGWEGWQTFPLQRDRLFKLIGEAKANGVIFISGDRHHAEISKLAIKDPHNKAGYPLYDVTSSSLNQPKAKVTEPNRHRIGNGYGPVNFGSIKIKWPPGDQSTTPPTVELNIHDIKGNVVRRISTPDLGS